MQKVENKHYIRSNELFGFIAGDEGVNGHYWLSTPDSDDGRCYHLAFDSGYAKVSELESDTRNLPVVKA